MSLMDELGGSIETVLRDQASAVVSIGGGWRGGSGIVVGDGLVLTNAHNVRGEEPQIRFSDGRTAEGRLIAGDVDGDLAVISVDTGGIAPLRWSTTAARVGQPVLVVSGSGERRRVTWGTVSSVAQAFRGPRGRRIAGSIEHTAPMAPGSSGSPVLTMDGQLLGLNTSRMDAFYLAIPADDALRARVDALGRGETPRQRRLGVAVAPAQAARRMRRAVGLPERDGVLIREVDPDGAGAEAGLREGDLIIAAGDRTVASVDDLQDVLAGAGAGELSLLVVRGMEDVRVTVPSDATSTEGPGIGSERAPGTEKPPRPN